MTTITEFKIGDRIKKVFEKQYVDNKIFKIVDLKEVKGGNWHDGFTISFVVTIEPETDENDEKKKEKEKNDYCIQYINYMCQINNVYAIKVE
jgi:hypothetical protein